MSLLYELCVGACGIWLLISGAGWLPFAAFVVVNLAALAIFDNVLWERQRFIRRPLDLAVGLVGNAALLAFPAILILDGDGRVRCLVALGLMVGIRLLMKAPPGKPLFRRKRKSVADP